MYCQKCGKPMEAGMKFCPYCGAPAFEPSVGDSDTSQNGVSGFVTVHFLTNGDSSDIKCYIHYAKDDTVLAEGFPGQTITFNCDGPMQIYAETSGKIPMMRFPIPVKPGDTIECSINKRGKTDLEKIADVRPQTNCQGNNIEPMQYSSDPGDAVASDNKGSSHKILRSIAGVIGVLLAIDVICNLAMKVTFTPSTTSGTVSTAGNSSGNSSSDITAQSVGAQLQAGKVYDKDGISISLLNAEFVNDYGNEAVSISFDNNTGKTIDNVSAETVAVNGYRVNAAFYGGSITEGNSLDGYYTLPTRLLEAAGMPVDSISSVVMDFTFYDSNYNPLFVTGDVEIGKKDRVYDINLLYNGNNLFDDDNYRITYLGTYVDQDTGRSADGSYMLASAAYPTLIFAVENKTSEEIQFNASSMAVDSKMVSPTGSLSLRAKEKGILGVTPSLLEQNDISSFEGKKLELELDSIDVSYASTKIATLKFSA